MAKQTEEYKFIPVRKSTHKRLKALSVKEEKTFDQLLQALMENHEKTT